MNKRLFRNAKAAMSRQLAHPDFDTSPRSPGPIFWRPGE
jgi:hypothetical protein